jgi:hypothetical protein
MRIRNNVKGFVGFLGFKGSLDDDDDDDNEDEIVWPTRAVGALFRGASRSHVNCVRVFTCPCR